ncbi:MAG TPA: hypothetical protein VH208_04355 [Myxococcaceae bacterium]|nr:hypothetical protein [Myxococcaceae bacterium]
MLLKKTLLSFVVGLSAPLVGVAQGGFDPGRDAEAKAEQARAAAANQFEAAIAEQRARDTGSRLTATDAPILIASAGSPLVPGGGLYARRPRPPAKSKVAAAPTKHRAQHRSHAPKPLIARATRKTGGR